jgi:hypothetical protein
MVALAGEPSLQREPEARLVFDEQDPLRDLPHRARLEFFGFISVILSARVAQGAYSDGVSLARMQGMYLTRKRGLSKGR